MFELDPPTDNSDSFSHYSPDTGGHDSSLQETTPITAPADWHGEDTVAEVSDLPPLTEEPAQPFTIVEIGSGGSPLLTSPEAPDIARLYEHGGKYIGVDANAAKLSNGRDSIGLYREVYPDPDNELDISFVHASIEPDQPLPEGLQADTADRVLISNVLTDPRVARHPDVCRAIANTAFDLVRKEPPGEVVMVGTITPRIFPAQAVEALLAEAGLEYVGADDINTYVAPQYKKDRDLMYVDRYRPAVTGAADESDTSTETEPGRDVSAPVPALEDDDRRRRRS